MASGDPGRPLGDDPGLRVDESPARRRRRCGRQTLSLSNPTEQDYLRSASLHAQLRNTARVAELLQTGAAKFPQSAKPRAALSELEPHPAKA